MSVSLPALLKLVSSIVTGVEPHAAADAIDRMIRKQKGDVRAFWAATRTLAEERLATGKPCSCTAAPEPATTCGRCGGSLLHVEVIPNGKYPD